jgi:hypothetical protein
VEIRHLGQLKSRADKEFIEENLTEEEAELAIKWQWKNGSFINCDLRYYPLDSLGGNFDIVLIDPPWYQ